jgi:hypothetical protein
MRTSLLIPLALAPLLLGCPADDPKQTEAPTASPSPSPPPGPVTTPTPRPTTGPTTGADPLCAEVQASIDAACVVCHAGAAASAGLDLSDVALTVGVPSTQSPLALVEPFAPDDSYLLRKIDGTHLDAGGSGEVMPPPGMPALPAGADIDVYDWIAAGAVCDPTGTDTGQTADTGPGTATGTADTGVPLSNQACDDAQSVFDTHCTSCHGATALGGLDLRRLDLLDGVHSTQVPGLRLFEPGDRGASYAWAKLDGSHLGLGGTGQAMPPGQVLDAVDLELVGAFIDAGASCLPDPDPPEEGEADPNQLDTEALFTCDGSPASSPARIRRLDDVEWRSTIGQSRTSAAASNPLAMPSHARYSTYPEGVGLDEASLDLYLGVLHYAGAGWTERFPGLGRQNQPENDSSLRCMFDDAEPDSDCIDNYLEQMLENGALYRPPTTDELARLRTFADDALATELAEGWERTDTLTQITSAAWLTTGALFPTELGQGKPDADGRYLLGDHELARVVSHMLSDRAHGSQGVFRFGLGLHDHYTEPFEGSMPDLQAAAADGSIQDPAVLGALLRQYAGGVDPLRADTHLDWGDDRRIEGRAEEWLASRIDRFFLEFFDVADFPTLFKDRVEATSAYDGTDDASNIRSSYGNLQSGYYGHEATMLQLFEDTVARIVVEDRDVLRELLTTREFFVASTTRDAGSSISKHTEYTAKPFGFDGDVLDGSPADRWVVLPDDERAGLLTHPAWLSSHGDAFEDGPSMVSRGHWIREHLLCESVPPLEFVTVEAQLLPTDGTKTARERVDESIEPHPECMVCHQSMNSLGRAFEIYNHAGFLRADDHGNAPDGSTTLDNAPDPALNTDYADAIEMMEAFADSQHVKRCFVRQTFRFFARRDETADDACVLSAMEEAYDDSGGSFLSMLEALATHDATRYRTREEP